MLIRQAGGRFSLSHHELDEARAADGLRDAGVNTILHKGMMNERIRGCKAPCEQGQAIGVLSVIVRITYGPWPYSLYKEIETPENGRFPA